MMDFKQIVDRFIEKHPEAASWREQLLDVAWTRVKELTIEKMREEWEELVK